MLQGAFVKYPLEFVRPSGTSRGVMHQKTGYFIKIWKAESPEIYGLGEVSIIEGLSIDNPEILESKITWLLSNLAVPYADLMKSLIDFPALKMGLEMAFLDLKSGGTRNYFSSHFTKGLQSQKINGLIWMGDLAYMHSQIESKIAQGFSCLKLKIGALNFEEEIKVIESIRKEYDAEELEIRVDANGAFEVEDALEKLNRLSEFDLHSIEQPIRQGQWEAMASLCENTPLDIALDEELIGVHTEAQRIQLLEQIQPQYIILKPSLLGGFADTYQWISIAGELSIPWWITSALESNVGLSAIAQFTAQFYNPLPQGLGTGQLYKNNVDCPLVLEGEQLTWDASINWGLSSIIW